MFSGITKKEDCLNYYKPYLEKCRKTNYEDNCDTYAKLYIRNCQINSGDKTTFDDSYTVCKETSDDRKKRLECCLNRKGTSEYCNLMDYYTYSDTVYITPIVDKILYLSLICVIVFFIYKKLI